MFEKNNKPFNKGKTLEQCFGDERAKEIKEKLAESKRGSHHSEETKQKMSNAGKNKPKTEAVKEKMRLSSKHFPLIIKNQTYEEFYGKEKADKIKNQRSLSMIGRKLSKETKTKIANSNKGKTWKISDEAKKNHRLSMIKYLEENLKNGGQITPHYSHLACDYFNQLMEQTKTFIQHAENGGEFRIKELGYWVDGYDKENNIVYEYDERGHYNFDGSLKDRDVRRQKEIIDFLNCTFIRIKEDKNLFK